MAVTSSGNTSLDTIMTSYQSTDAARENKNDALGRDAFLTMLVAQLQNQDPLNPMDGTDFSSQLAQFSQLEQLMNLNESMDSLATSFGSDANRDLVSYVGKKITGEVDTMAVKEGTVSGGFFNLAKSAEIRVEITDSTGKTVKTLSLGTKGAGAHTIAWDGTDQDDKAVDDGTYTYSVLANTGSGFAKVPNTITGQVDGVAYSNGKAYLAVNGVLVDPDHLSSVTDIQDDTSPVDSAMSYLGKTVSSGQPIIEVKDGVVQGEDLGFELEKAQDATVKIYDPFDELVATISLAADDATDGSNTVHWNAVGTDGFQVNDGLYYYTVETNSGYAETPVSEEVSGIKNANGSQYLVLNDTGRLVALSSITEIKN